MKQLLPVFALLLTLPVFAQQKDSATFNMPKKMNELVIKSKKPFMEIQADKTVLNVQADMLAASGSVFELLQRAPGVSITNDENISMAGKSGVLVLIDGRPTQLSSKDLANYLKATPGSVVDKIELISNPSARYDAQGNAGIINIRLKKNTVKGTNGNLSVAYTQSVHANINASAGINRRQGKWNWFANLSARKWRQNTDGFINRFVTSNGITKTFENTTVDQDPSGNAGYQFGADYYLNKKNTFGLLARGNEYKSRLYTPGSTLIRYNNVTDSSLNTLNDNRERTSQFSINLNYKYEDTLGTQWSVDADYARFKKNTSGYVTTDLLDAQNTKYGFTANDQTVLNTVNIYSLKTDLVKQLKKWNASMEAGVKFNTVQTLNDLTAFVWDNNRFSADSGRTNRFDYTETQFAAYASINKKIKQWEYQLGLRAEQTSIKGKSTGLDNKFSRYPDTAYLNIFPTVFIRYTINDKNSFGLSFGRRINRPDYHYLNPFEYIYDNYSKERGNPYLLPEFSQQVAVSYSWRGQLNLEMGYSFTNNSFQQVSALQGETIFATQYNIGNEKRLYLNVSMGLPVTKWCESYINLSPHYKKYEGRVPEGKLDNEASGMGWYSSQAFSLPRKWKFQVSSWGNISTRNAMTKTAWLGSLDAGLSKTLLKDKCTARLSVTDIFNTQRWKQSVNFGNVQYNYLRKWESRTVRLQLSWKFGKTGFKARDRETGAQDQLNRVK